MRPLEPRRELKKRLCWARRSVPRAVGVRREPPGGTHRYGFTLSDEQIRSGVHRDRVGGQWEVIGALQFDFLVAEGLAASSYLLDVGCGAMRGGIHFARYLDPGHYFGVDVNGSLIRAAHRKEIPEAGLRERVPAGNLRVTDRFECDFGVPFDFALAVSVFTHLPLNHIRLCLYQVAQVMPPGGRFFASFFEVPEGTPYDEPVRQVVTRSFPERNPYHYRPADLEWAATSVGPWELRYLGDWGHPRGQQMLEFRRL